MLLIMALAAVTNSNFSERPYNAARSKILEGAQTPALDTLDSNG